VFDDCESLVAFLTAQKKDNPEFLNFHEVICGQSYQKLRFDVDAPVEFLEQIMPNFEKPELDAEPAKPKPTGLNLIGDLELGLYEEKLAKVRRYNDYVNNTSLNMWCGVHIMTHLNVAIKKAFADFFSSRIDPLFNIHDMDKNFLVFDFSNETKFSRHIIIPGFHFKNYHEAKAFADEVVRNLDAKFCPDLDLGVYKSLQNFRLFMNHKVGSSRVKQYKVGVFRAFSDLLIAYIPEYSFKLPSILARKAVKNAAKIETDLTNKNIQAIIKLVNELAPSYTLNKVIGNMVLFTRRGTGYCPICKREHVNDNTHFVIVHDQVVHYGPRHSSCQVAHGHWKNKSPSGISE